MFKEENEIVELCMLVFKVAFVLNWLVHGLTDLITDSPESLVQGSSFIAQTLARLSEARDSVGHSVTW